MKSITKTFGPVVANGDVNLNIEKGEIHAVIGENGAGKSTIMKILYGFYQADSGEIEVFGNKVKITTPHEAIALGIGMVHQHFMLVPPLTVAENIILGVEPTRKGGILEMPKAVEAIRKISEGYGLKIDPTEKVENLSVGLQQRVEIIKALYRGAEILILDEPTAVLTPLEVREFFKILKLLKGQGKTIVIITHKLNEVLEISDNITVMRGGKKVGNIGTKDATAESLASMMVGREVLLRVEKKEANPQEVLLDIQNVTVRVGAKDRLKDLCLSVRRGEIVGIAGIEGNGQTELIEMLTGLTRVKSGKVFYNNQDITNASARRIRELKIAHVPADRGAHGYIPTYSNEENLILGYHHQAPFCKKSGFFDFKKIAANALKLIEKFQVMPPIVGNPTSALSGGNQQKVIVAREFSQDPDLLIIAQPTRGVDIGAIEFIHQQILDLRDRGKAILLVSAELEEVRSLADRALVFYEGEIAGEIDLENYNESTVGLMMTGQQPKSA